MASTNTIAASIQTLLDKGYSMAEIDAIRYSVPKGDNRRATALAQAASSYGTKQQPTAPTPAPTPRPLQDTTPRRLVDNQDSDNLKIKKKSKRRRFEQSRGTGQLRINREGSMNLGSSAPAASGGINI